jgi:transposase
VIAIQSIQTRACCPCCDQPSERIHSHYRRQVADLPWQGRHVVLRITLRRFRCANPACQQKVFCERLPALLRDRSQSTTRLIQAHRWIGHALGGEAGSRLTKRLSLPTSPDTLLRRIREIPGRVASTPRILGVDDFAFRRGHTYGTVLVDLECRCLIDLLPDREAATLSKWLQEHQGIEIVSRDRGTAYAQAVRASLPQAIQVADRWHLLKNLQEALQKVFQRSFRTIRRAITTEPQPQEASMTTVEKKPIDQQRLRVFQQVRTWHAQGLSLRQIMKRTGLHYVTVRRYLDAESCPDWHLAEGGRANSML